MKNSTGKVVDFSPSQEGFKTQAVPQGTVVFTESFQVTRPNQDLTRQFKVPDTGKRYIVHVAKQEPQRSREGRVQVNLNGAWVIREKDFERGEEEFQTTGLLLNANNSLQIRFKGKTDSRLTLTVVEAGEAGTILRRRGWERDKDLTQADRVRNNDTNFFDPNDPNSLGGLQPYEGDQVTESNPNQGIGETEANGSRSQIFTGEIWVALQEPRAEKLQALLQRYPVELISEDEFSGVGIAFLRLKLDEIPLNSLAENVQILNTRTDIPALTSATFSSVNTAKTLALTLEMQINGEDLIYGVALNHVLKSQSTEPIEASEEQDLISLQDKPAPLPPYSASSFWWLNETRTREAWNYSGGYDATVAILDQDFGYIYNTSLSVRGVTQQIQGYKDFTGRVISAPGTQSYLRIPSTKKDDLLPVDGDPNLDRPVPEPFKLGGANPGHGLWVSQVLASGLDNQQGIVGVAPLTKILPVNIAGGLPSLGDEVSSPNSEFSLTEQLNRLLKENTSVDAINISTGRKMSFWDLFVPHKLALPLINQTLIIPGGYTNLGIGTIFLGKSIQDLIAKNAIVVASGGNYGDMNDNLENSDLNIPSSFIGVIAVGAYQKKGGVIERAIFDTYIGDSDIASNYGPRIDIWAPGKDIFVINRVFNSARGRRPDPDKPGELLDGTIGYEEKIYLIEGTSHAAPQVAGLIALMKSWNKNLNSQQALDILRATGTHYSSANFAGSPNPIGINALAALQDPRVGAKQAQKFCGIVPLDFASTGQLIFNGQRKTPQNADFRSYPALSGVQAGEQMAVLGWSQTERPTLNSNTIQVLQIKKDNNCSSGGFNTKIFFSPLPGTTPESAGVNAFYNPNSTTPITARAGDLIGFYTANARTRNISIEIQGQNAVLTAVDDNLLTMTVPANLLIGNLDVLFKSDEGEFKIENLINYTSPFPEVVKFSKPTIFANGGDVVDAYITVKDANGQPAPDGTPYYVQLVPTQLGLYPDLTMIHPETGQQYGGRWTTVEQVLPVKNGKIHIQAKLTAPIGPYEYTYDFSNSLPNVFTWPHANAPSFQVQVCNPAYNSNKPGYGYYCGQQLFPQAGNTLDGRLYAVHAYSFDPQIQHVTAGSPKRTITIRNIKDILGNPVPVGTVLHFNQTYWGTVSNPNGNDIYWGVTVQTPGEVEIVYEPLQRLSCGLVGVEEQVYITTVQGAVGNPLHWLVGNPIYFRYVAC
ncbi:MAG: S8 family serine peptidase [Candidatus Sericytochromatia bacterium]